MKENLLGVLFRWNYLKHHALTNLINNKFVQQDVKPGEHMVCQQYVSKPFLIDGFKFDLRVYVLVTSCDPLRIFVYEDGLGRFATLKYVDPSNNNLVSKFYSLLTITCGKFEFRGG